jgi:hypothetical protein
MCAEKEDYTLMNRRVHFEELPHGYEIMPQHALWNAIVESYVPHDLIMKDEKLYYSDLWFLYPFRQLFILRFGLFLMRIIEQSENKRYQ